MLFVLYKKSAVRSGRALRKMLTQVGEKDVAGGYPARLASTLKAGGKPKAIINLGVTDDLGYKGPILNTQDMVRAASNKRAARRTFADRGIPAPELFLKPGDVSKGDLPVVGRTSYHRKGEGFWLCTTLAAVRRAAREGATHFLKFIPNTREYRVHTWIKVKHRDVPPEKREDSHYVSIKISEKVWEGKAAPDEDEPQKNHAFGWTFRGPQNRRDEELDVVRHVAKQAIAALGADFGAVDVMYRIRNKKPYVLEVNSTPSLADPDATTCEVYAQRIQKTLSLKKEK